MNFELWINQAQGGVMYKLFPKLKKALAYAKKHQGEGSFAIKYPNGKWYKWE